MGWPQTSLTSAHSLGRIIFPEQPRRARQSCSRMLGEERKSGTQRKSSSSSPPSAKHSRMPDPSRRRRRSRGWRQTIPLSCQQLLLLHAAAGGYCRWAWFYCSQFSYVAPPPRVSWRYSDSASIFRSQRADVFLTHQLRVNELTGWFGAQMQADETLVQRLDSALGIGWAVDEAEAPPPPASWWW